MHGSPAWSPITHNPRDALRTGPRPVHGRGAGQHPTSERPCADTRPTLSTGMGRKHGTATGRQEAILQKALVTHRDGAACVAGHERGCVCCANTCAAAYVPLPDAPHATRTIWHQHRAYYPRHAPVWSFNSAGCVEAAMCLLPGVCWLARCTIRPGLPVAGCLLVTVLVQANQWR